MQVAGLIKAFKRACAPGGHYLDYYVGTPLILFKVTSTHIKIWCR